MSKKVAKVVKLEIIGGQAKPGSALASAGINMPKFCTEFNAKTQDRAGKVVPVIITAFEDKSFEFVIKTTPAAILIKEAAGIKSGSSVPNKTKVATITKAQLEEIAKIKMPDLNAASLESAMSMIAGTCRSMGVKVAE